MAVIIKDVLAAIRAGIREARDTFKRRRWIRDHTVRDDLHGPF
jgi:hypothetical protein